MWCWLYAADGSERTDPDWYCGRYRGQIHSHITYDKPRAIGQTFELLGRFGRKDGTYRVVDTDGNYAAAQKID